MTINEAARLQLALCIVLLGWALANVGRLFRGPGSARWTWVGACGLAISEAAAVLLAHADGLNPASAWLDGVRAAGALLAVTCLVERLADSLPTPRPWWLRVRARVAWATATLLITVSTAAPVGGVPWPAIRRTFFLACLAGSLILATLTARRRARAGSDRRVRTGMQLIGVGSGTSVAQVGVMVLGSASPRTERLLETAVLGTATGLVAVGLGWADLAEMIAVARLRRRVRVLRPLWTELIAYVPEVSPFSSAVRRAGSSAQHLRFQEVRMVVEIYEVLRRTSGQHPGSVRITAQVQARGLSGEAAAAAGRHILLLLDLQARRRRSDRLGLPREPHLPVSDLSDAAVHLAREARLLFQRDVRLVIDAVLASELHRASTPPTDLGLVHT